jgi:hypothetical protein
LFYRSPPLVSVLDDVLDVGGVGFDDPLGEGAPFLSARLKIAVTVC